MSVRWLFRVPIVVKLESLSTMWMIAIAALERLHFCHDGPDSYLVRFALCVRNRCVATREFSNRPCLGLGGLQRHKGSIPSNYTE